MPPFVTTMAIAAISGLVGFLIISFTELTVSEEISFFIGALTSGLMLAILQHKNSEGSATDSNSDATAASGPKAEQGADGYTTLYVGNLPYRVNEGAVKEHFSSHTKVKSVRLLRDRKTGKRKGFGFVEVMSSDTDKVIKALNDSEFEERTLKVRQAKDRNAEE